MYRSYKPITKLQKRSFFENNSKFIKQQRMKGAIYALYHVVGMSFNDISKYLNCSKSNVNYNFHKQSLYRRNKSNKLSEVMINHLESKILEDNSISLAALKSSLYDEFNVSVCTSTVRNALKRRGFKSVIAKNKPELKQEHIRQRISYCENNMNTFNNTIFVDESTFQIEPNKVSVWTKSKNRQINAGETLNTYTQNNNAKVNVFGAIMPGEGKLFLKLFLDNMNQNNYKDVVFNELLPEIHRRVGDWFKLQQDNAPYHKTAMIQDLFQQNNIKLYQQPAKSPDLNPIERLWHYLKFKVNQRRPKTQTQLEKYIEEEWEKMNNNTVKLFICKHYEIVDRIYKNNGNAVFE